MLILVAMACPDPPENLSLHRGSHLWQQSVVATMEKSRLDRGWQPLPPPNLRITSAQRRWAGSQTPWGGTSTLGLNIETRSKKNVLSMLLNLKFRILPALHSLS